MAADDGKNLNRHPDIVLLQQWRVGHEAVLPPDLQTCAVTRIGPAQWFGLGTARPADDLLDDMTGKLGMASCTNVKARASPRKCSRNINGSSNHVAAMDRMPRDWSTTRCDGEQQAQADVMEEAG